MMDRRIVTCLVACSLMLVAGAGLASAQEDMPEMTPEMQAEMASWMKLAQPGEHHEHLAPFAGKWKGAVEMWMEPGSEPMKNETMAEASWIMSGRFLIWEQTGDFGGMPWEGMAIEGYNNGDQRYESTRIDNFGTLMLTFEGTCSDDGRSRAMNSEFNDVVGGGTVKYKVVYTWIDEDHFTYEAFMDKGEGEFKNLSITYERQ